MFLTLFLKSNFPSTTENEYDFFFPLSMVSMSSLDDINVLFSTDSIAWHTQTDQDQSMAKASDVDGSGH